ncbi:penicillin-insensitive murein endopeptidase [Alsobacter sp. SYSU M60028]|uniref:Penicillin-insensitive murein endopeptidase n=1 Tax=Alsobacter ponti TaxID=2962936 RepID=A0ABT1LB89_9HYPH|nr:penicillin-insensitive murein endopeptidase [Alsobacter ponti]MCP8938030.1 penicillin-insensitive murein endopeptidase [Alsobacter ponti]
MPASAFARGLAALGLSLVVASPAVSAEPAARDLFGAAGRPAALREGAIGSYARGCLAGGEMLPAEGPHWQAMRLSRNRNWGHPRLVSFLTAFSARVPALTGWPGLLVGDIAQPRGGPMRSGHASHQIGLDADIWLTPMPPRVLSRQEREDMEPVNLVAADGRDVIPERWTPAHRALIRALAEQPGVERVFVNPAIKKALCREAGTDRDWLGKVRPIYGHNYHTHVRLACPAREAGCMRQTPPPGGDGCGAELAWWFTDEAMHPKPSKPAPPLTLAQLPPACRIVLSAP